MKGKRYLAKNIGLLTISQFGTKLLTFFLVPLYTNVLSTQEYGSYDLFATTTSLLIPIFTLNITEAVLRYSLDDNETIRKKVFSVGLKYSLVGTVLISVTAILNHVFNIFQTIDKYWYYLPLLFILTMINTLFLYFARGINRVKETAIGGGICSAVMIILNIFFLLGLKIGIHGYFWAQMLAMLVQAVYLFISCKMWIYVGFPRDKILEKEMIKYSVPIIANTVSWWINNSSDRYIITWICGVSANGIYSVAYKIPSIINTFQSIFFQAWTLSAVKDFDSEDKSGLFTDTYNLYNCGMTIICSLLIIFTKILAKILYAKEFYEAWKYAPFLTIALVFGAMSGFEGAVFSAVKDTKAYARTTVVGAAVNIILNIFLVFMIGPMGAAVATAFSYFLVWILRTIQVRKYIKINIHYTRDILSYMILIIQAFVLYQVEENSAQCLCGAGLFFVITILYYRVLKNIGGKLIDILKSRLENRRILNE